MRPLLATWVLAGCHHVIGLDEREDAGPSALPAFCTEPELFDDFGSAGIPCPWGGATPADRTGIVQRNGVLEITVVNQRFVGCTAFKGYPLSERGIFVRVRSPLTTPTSYTVMSVRGMAAGSAQYKLAYDGTTDFFVDDKGQTSRVGEFMPWWRIRRTADGVAAELSIDGVGWDPLIMHSGTAPDMVAIDIGAGVNGPSTAGMAQIDAFGVCK